MNIFINIFLHILQAPANLKIFNWILIHQIRKIFLSITKISFNIEYIIFFFQFFDIII